jgi:uncharacterized membrane protein
MIWSHRIFSLLDWLQIACGLFCAAAAALFVAKPPALDGVEARLTTPGLVRRRLPPLLLGAAVPALAVLYMLAQYRSYRLDLDTGAMANAAWCFLHGRGWLSSALSDRSYFGIHFAFVTALISPLLLARESAMTLLAAQAAAVGSTIYAAYLLGRRNCGAAWAGWCLALLTASQPLFRESLGATLDNANFALPLFVWGVYFWESERLFGACVCAALFLTTKEQAPFALAGLGLLASARARDRRQLLAGLAVVAASALLWIGEMSVIERAQRLWPHPVDRWIMFKSMGGSKAELLDAAFRRPWVFVRILVYPFWRLETPVRALVSLSLLPLLSGAYLLPALAVWLPQQLADSSFQSLAGQYAAFVGGPLIWSAVHGLSRVLARARPRTRRYVAAGVLAVAAHGFLAAPNSSTRADYAIFATWENSAPAALRAIPPDARVWTDGYLTPHLAMRRYLKTLPSYPDDHFFEDGLFMPDRVVLTRRWLALAEPGTRGRILAFLNAHRFVSVFSDENIAVMAGPGPFGGNDETTAPASLP